MNHKLLVWTPRVLAILYAAFISLFALDVWEMPGSFLQRLGGFLIHLVPTYFIIAATILAWKRPFAGGVVFLSMGAAFTLFFGWAEMETFLLMAGPLFLIGLLFILEGWLDQPTLRPRF